MGNSKLKGKITKKSNKNIVKTESPQDFSVTFLGVRGTIPTPNKKFMRYGGNTSCLKITSTFNKETTHILFDAGTGIVNYGDGALKEGQRIFHIFLTHMHYDHIIGLTKFAPLFRTDCQIHFYGQPKEGLPLKQIIEDFFGSPFFPITLKDLPSNKNISFHEISTKESINVNHVRIDAQCLNHPQSALAFRIWNANKTAHIVYATDHEHGSKSDIELKKFIKNTYLFIYDSTYSEKEYKNHKGWGHSTAKFGAQLAKDSNVNKFAIFHHDPSHTDRYLEEIVLPEAKKIFHNSILAKENFTLKIKD